MPEKRRWPRKRRRLTVEFRWDKATCTGFTYDISPSSLFVRTGRIPKVGTRLAIKMILPDETLVPIVGVVVRSFRVPSSLARVIPSGFCLKILERAPESYLRFLAAA
jgi:hypothetical protein